MQGTILVAVDHASVGGALNRALERQGHPQVLTLPAHPGAWEELFDRERPAYVIAAAGPSGGIGANQRRPGELMRENLLADVGLLELSRVYGVRKLLYLAAACVYPRLSEQPMHVDSLLTGALEPTSEAYSLAKLAAVRMCEAYRRQYGCDFIAAIPAGIVGPDDHFHPDDSHVAAALLLKMHEAKSEGLASVEIWGTGNARRELIAADDLAEACLFLLERYEGPGPINVGSGEALSVRELAAIAREIVGYTGELRFDETRPDGAPVKMLDSEPLRALGWQPRIDLRTALALAYEGLQQKERTEGARAAV